MIHAFISGELIRDPQERTSQNGNAFVTALLRNGDGLISLSAFNADIRETLARLKKGDPVAASGRLTTRPYLDKNGEPQAGLSVTVTELMTAPARKAKPKPRRSTRTKKDKPGEAASSTLDEPFIDDDLDEIF